MDFTEIHDNACGIAREAGSVLMRYFGSAHAESTKSSDYDIVTEADGAAETLIVQALQAAYPGHHIVGEEGTDTGAAVDEAEYFWYIDPLDGTTNYANNIPHFSVSMALTDKHMKPLVGVVYHPVVDEMYTAIAGKGAMLNGSPARVSTADTLGQSVLATGFPYDKRTNPDNNLSEWCAFTTQSRGIRRIGSAALDLAYVAAGRLDGYWEQRLNAWDMLAGILCVIEAGGRVTDYTGEESAEMYSGNQAVASNGNIHGAMLKVLAEARKNF